MARLRSTDLDLLKMQVVMGKLRHPDMNDKELLAMLEAGKDKLSTRFTFVDVAGKSTELVPEHKMRHVYDMSAKFQLRVKLKSGVVVTCRANVGVRAVPGVAKNHKECLVKAKEAFRLHLGKVIRDASHPFYNKFLDQITLITDDQEFLKNSDEVLKVKDIFRKFIGNNIRDANSALHKDFFSKVMHTEVKDMRVCAKCDKEKPVEHFPSRDMADETGMDIEVCLECAPPPPVQREIDDEESDEDEDSEDEVDEEVDDQVN